MTYTEGTGPTVCRAEDGGALEAHLAGSPLGEAHPRQQDLGTLRSAAQTIHLVSPAWNGPLLPSLTQGSPPHLPVRGLCFCPALGSGQGQERSGEAHPIGQSSQASRDPGEETQAT